MSLAKPTNVTAATRADGAVEIKWTDNSGAETGYQIQRKTHAGIVWGYVATPLPANSSWWVDRTAAAGVSYDYRVRCYRPGNITSPWSDVATVNVPVPPPVAQPPTDIILSATSVAEDAAIGTVVGTLTAVDPDSATFTFSLITNANTFTIVGNQLRTSAALDYETQSSYSILIRATDPTGLYVEKTFTITVTDVYETPAVAFTTKLVNGHLIINRQDAAFAGWVLDDGEAVTYARHVQRLLAEGIYHVTDGLGGYTTVVVPADTRPVVDVPIGSPLPTWAANTIYRFQRGGTWTVAAPIALYSGSTVRDYGAGAKPTFTGPALLSYQPVFRLPAAGGAQVINVTISSSGRGIATSTPTIGANGNLVQGVTFTSIGSSCVNNEAGGSVAVINCSGNASEYFCWLGNAAALGNYVYIDGCTSFLARDDAAVVRGHVNEFLTIVRCNFNGNNGGGSAIRAMEGRYMSVTDNTLTGAVRFCENTATWGASYDPTLFADYCEFIDNIHSDGKLEIGKGADTIDIKVNTFLRDNPCGTWCVIDPQEVVGGVVRTSDDCRNITLEGNTGLMPGTGATYAAGDFVQVGNTGSIPKVGYPSNIVIMHNQYDMRAVTVAASYAVRICGPQSIVTSCSGNEWTIKTGKPVGQINGSNVLAAAWPFADTITQV